MAPSYTTSPRTQACRRLNAKWVCTLFPTPPIFNGKDAGGAGALAANSAALFRLILLSSVELEELARQFDEWLTAKADRRQAPPFNWSAEDTLRVLSGRRQMLVFGFVYRAVDRQIGADRVNEMLGAAALWSFGRLPETDQLALVRHVERRHADQRTTDEAAAQTLERIFSE